MNETGTIQRFDADKSYGFIEPDAGFERIFVHIKECPGRPPLQRGARVEYTSHPNREKGGVLYARNVRLIQSAQ